jgi:asparagine synthase (glutamine-hydrolysing)
MSTLLQLSPKADRSATIVRARLESPLGTHPSRQRPVGRIGGLIGDSNPAALALLARALGPGAQLLTDDLVVDWDCSTIDGRFISDLGCWRSIMTGGRLSAVEGAFALAWKSADGTLTLARDAIGHRTLYYSVLPQGIIFASSVRALLATGLVPRTLNVQALASYLSYAYLPGRETLVAGVHEVLPGELLLFRDGQVLHDQFWRVPPEQAETLDEESLCLMLRERIEQAVQRRLPANEAVGAFLSGGLDSSLVVALASRLHDAPVKTFSISFGSEYANELPFSSLVAEHCRTEHRIVELSPAVVLHHLDDTIRQLGDPIGDPLTVPNALLFREAAAEVGVVLNGEGGDPCFGGPKNLPMLLAEIYGNDGDQAHARQRSYLRAHLKCFDDLSDMLLPNVRASLSESALYRPLTDYFSDPRWQAFVTKLQAINVVFKGGHHILPKVDALSAASGVLARSPLFDQGVVELAFQIPPQLKLKGSVEKYLLKQAVRDLLPSEIMARPKSGMLVPVESWFRGPLLNQARERVVDGLAPYGVFQTDYLERLLAGRLGGLRPRHGAKVWLLVTLEAWLRTVLNDSSD